MFEWKKYSKLIFPILTIASLGVAVLFYFQKNGGGDTSEQSLVIDTQQDVVVSDERASIYLDVSGAVEKPGFYKMHAGDRVVDVLKATGGLSAHANTTFVAQKLNLSRKVADGEKIYIPFIFDESPDEIVISQNLICSESTPQATVDAKESSDGSSDDEGNVGAGEKVDVNTATKDELLALYGIGETYASKIIQNRPYKDMTEFYAKIKLNSKTKAALEGLLTAE